MRTPANRRSSLPSGVRTLTSCLVVLAVWAAVASAAGPAGAADDGGPAPWPQFGRDATHAAESPSATPAPPFRRAWKFDMPKGERALSYPVVAGDTVIAVGKLAVYGVDAATGEPRWHVPRDGGSVAAVPAVADVGGTPVLVFTQGAKAADSSVVAYSLADESAPKLLWQVPLEDRTGSGVSIDGDTAFLGDASGNVVAVHLAAEAPTGKPDLIDWQTNVPGVLDTPPAVDGGRVFVAARSRTTGQVEVASLSEDSGEVSWTFAPSAQLSNASAVTVVGNRVLVGFFGDNTLYALTAQDGAQIWTARLSSQFLPFASNAAAGGYVYAMPSQFGLESGLYRIQLSTGRYATPWNFGTDGLWTFEFDVSAFYASPVVVGNTVVVGLDDGRLAAIDVGSGVLVWRTDTGEGAIHGIAATDDSIVASVGSRNGGLFGFVNDPSGVLLAEVSSVKPNWGRMLLNYAVAFAAVGLVALLLALLLRRKRGGDAAPIEPEETVAEEPA